MRILLVALLATDVATAQRFLPLGHQPLPNQTTLTVPGLGRLLGNKLRNNVTEFVGIPFAAPAVGNRRFLPPGPLMGGNASWPDATLNATGYGAACPQFTNATDFDIAPGCAEDCFYLNVWKPPDLQPGEKLPVFFWVYGGGFVIGAGSEFNGTQLTRGGLWGDTDASRAHPARIVVVTFNYRLGALGFFQSPEVRDAAVKAGLPASFGGMNGLLDAVSALHWTRKHIGAFGGDADTITIGVNDA